MASVLMQIEVVQTLQNMLLVEIGVLRTVNRGRLIRFIGQLPWCSNTDTPTFSNPANVRHGQLMTCNWSSAGCFIHKHMENCFCLKTVHHWG